MLLAHGVAAAEPPPEGATANPVGGPVPSTVTIEGRRDQEQIAQETRSFVSSVAVSKWDEPLARWQEEVCPLVAGLPGQRGVAISKRVSQIAAEAGIPLGPPGCSPNLLIIASTEPAARIQELWTAYPKMMNDERGAGGIERFIHGSQPIRVWHNACSEEPTTQKGIRRGARCDSRTTKGSLLSFESIRSIYSAVVAIDLGQTKELDDRQLAGYVAMIALAQIRDSTALGMPTILRLFSEPNSLRPQDLSNVDRAFLKALYTVNPGDATQAAEIARDMQRQLTP